MKFIFGVSLVGVLLCSSSVSAQSRSAEFPSHRKERRVALVIGNTAYETSPLLNSVNDARDVAGALREFGFEVIFKENLSPKEMRQAIRTFGAGIGQEGVGLFYYAGHAVQVNGHDYLIPVAARISSEADLEDLAVDVGQVLVEMVSSKNSTNIVILDACRNNPFPRNRASAKRLAPPEAPPRTFIAYATAPGGETGDGRGRNGVYTQELLKAIRTAGLSLEEIFKRVRVSVQRLTYGRQTPWESSSLTSDFYFNPIDEKWLEGSWEGTAYQGSVFAARTIRLAVQNNAYALEYPSQSCRGDWALLQSQNGKATLREKRMNGRNSCEDGGEIVLERVNNSQLVFKYFSPGRNEIRASAILNKLTAQAQRAAQ